MSDSYLSPKRLQVPSLPILPVIECRVTVFSAQKTSRSFGLSTANPQEGVLHYDVMLLKKALLQYAAARLVMVFPVSGIQIADTDLINGRAVDEIAVSYIDAHMVNAAAAVGIEKYEIAGFQV